MSAVYPPLPELRRPSAFRPWMAVAITVLVAIIGTLVFLGTSAISEKNEYLAAARTLSESRKGRIGKLTEQLGDTEADLNARNASLVTCKDAVQMQQEATRAFATLWSRLWRDQKQYRYVFSFFLRWRLNTTLQDLPDLDTMGDQAKACLGQGGGAF